MKFIMVTDFENHWDQIHNNETSYPLFMCKELPKNILNELVNDYKGNAIFIKIKKSEHKNDIVTEDIWEGKLQITKRDNKRIWFKVSGLTKKKKDVSKYIYYKKRGWFLEKESEPNFYLEPRFFRDLLTTTEHEDFEDLTYKLLKLLGINDIYQIPRENQAGKPDGFYKIGNLVVIYDCTLNDNYAIKKGDQIENYISKLKENPLKYNNISFYINDCDKRVWIITRRGCGKIKTSDNILAEEISVNKLIEIYNNRLNEKYDEKRLIDILKKIND